MKKIFEQFQKNLILYLQEEIKLFPPKAEIQDWHKETLLLQTQVDQIDMRLDELLKLL